MSHRCSKKLQQRLPPGANTAMRLPRGASTVLVLAVLVSLAGITAYSVGAVTTAMAQDSRALAAERARQAAFAGLEWGQFRVLAGPAAACAPLQNINSLPGVLSNYTVSVRCTTSGPYTEGASTVRRYRLLAQACNQPAAGACPNGAGGADYVQVSLSTTVER